MSKKKKQTFSMLVTERGLSMRTLADKIGVHYSYLCHMGRGRRMPTLERAMVISKALKTTPEHLFKLIAA